MKNSTRSKAWMLLTALIAAAFLCALLPTARVHAASTLKLDKTICRLFLYGGRDKYNLSAYYNNTEVQPKWSSSNKRVAVVTSKGVVKAKRTGTAVITAKFSGKTAKCKIRVGKRSTHYKKCIKAYNDFLMRPYVTYTDSGLYGQADYFHSSDLDNDGIPELLVSITSPQGNMYYVLYNFSRSNRISTGQRLGICSDFVWYSKPKMVSFTQYSSGKTLEIYSKHNTVTLNSKAIAVTNSNGNTTYYKSNGSMSSYGTKVSALKFRSYVDHDLLKYSASSAMVMHLNTPYNRSRYLN